MAEDDLSHLVVETVNRMPMPSFVLNGRHTSSAQRHPLMMLAPLEYCYANRICVSRRIEWATFRDTGVRYVASNCYPDHDTVCAFRGSNIAEVAKAFEQVLPFAQELMLFRLGMVSVDGTKVDANPWISYAREGTSKGLTYVAYQPLARLSISKVASHVLLSDPFPLSTYLFPFVAYLLPRSFPELSSQLPAPPFFVSHPLHPPV